jgi:acetyltransferase-like isoleucine patch superfamily enzyme
MDMEELQALFRQWTHFKSNPFHPLVWIIGTPEIGEGVYIGGFSQINGNGARVQIGNHCDIASFVTINCADSHLRCLGLAEQIQRRDIILEEHVFVGSHSVIKGGVHIGHHSVIAAGTVVDPGVIPPYSLVSGNPMQVKAGYYRDRFPDTPDEAGLHSSP